MDRGRALVMAFVALAALAAGVATCFVPHGHIRVGNMSPRPEGPAEHPVPIVAQPAIAELPPPTTERVDVALPQLPAPSPARDHIRTATYSVRDILWTGTEGVPHPPDATELAVILRQATDPDYWRQGETQLADAGGGYVVVSASARMHQQVKTVLRGIRSSPKPARR
jgi:hypothetical protein